MLTISGLNKSFPGVPALREVSLILEPNRFVTLVGPSGCGKSTLFRILAGLDQPDFGSIQLNGSPLHQQKERSQLFGYMPQRDALLPWRTILQNILIGPEIEGRDRQAAQATAMRLLNTFGLDGFENNYPHTLSGGMRQRAALLRTYLADRDILLLDEPFGALDALTRRELQQWLLGIHQRMSKTILFITHDIDEAIYLGDKVLVMSPRPGHIEFEAIVPLPRPRTPDMLAQPAFQTLKVDLLNQLTS